MRNFIRRGDKLQYANSTGEDISSGDVVIVGALVGVAETDIVDGDSGTLVLTGVVSLPKAAVAITQGAKVYWDNTANNVTTVATNNTQFGVAGDAALAGDATVNVALTNGL